MANTRIFFLSIVSSIIGPYLKIAKMLFLGKAFYMDMGWFWVMETARRIYKNTTYLGIAEVISRVLQFIVMLYAARILTQENFGKFSFALSLAFIAVILADLGINVLLIREISRNKKLASKYFINASFIPVA